MSRRNHNRKWRCALCGGTFVKRRPFSWIGGFGKIIEKPICQKCHERRNRPYLVVQAARTEEE